MRIAIATTQAPFIRGGAENLAAGLAAALRRAGHEADIVSIPFRFAPVDAVRRSIAIWKGEDFEVLNGQTPDRVICLRFPSWCLGHPHKVAWVLHQHRAAYDLWGTPHDGGLSATREGRDLRAEIADADGKGLRECHAVYTIGWRVSERLRRHNGIDSTPLHHPPLLADRLHCAPAESYILYPSRLEDLKRQDLLIRALAHVRSPVVALIVGDGGRRSALQGLIDRLGLARRVRLLGWVGDDELVACYAQALGVYFGPYDEDYGYVALEAMLAGKPVITCTDSGGPLEFVRDGRTGRVVAPDPVQVAAAIDSLWEDRARAAAMGRSGRELYEALGITWDRALDALLRQQR